MEKLKIDLENLGIYEVDLDEVPFDFDALSEEERKEIDDFNDKFINEKIQPMLLSNAAPCQCRMPEIMERHMRRSSLMQDPRMANMIQMTQEDVDAWKFSVIVYMEHGKYTEVRLTVRECRKCHAVTFWGDSDVFTQLMAESITRLYNVRNHPETEGVEALSEEEVNEETLRAMGLDPEQYSLETIGTDEEDTDQEEQTEPAE